MTAGPKILRFGVMKNTQPTPTGRPLKFLIASVCTETAFLAVHVIM
jgi:hypothetical protein